MNSGRKDSQNDDADFSADKTIQSDDFGQFPPVEDHADNHHTMMFPEGDDSHTVDSSMGEFPSEIASQAELPPQNSVEEQPKSSLTAGNSAPSVYPGVSDSKAGDANSADSQQDSEANSQTFISDDSFPMPPENGPPTLSSDLDLSNQMSPADSFRTMSSQESNYDSAPHTILSEDDFELQDPGKTYQSDEITKNSGGDASAQTFVSDGEVDYILSKTWGAGINSGTNPGMTIKAAETFDPVALKHNSIPVRRLEENSSGKGGEYELMKVLGEGGMGIVWNARQSSVERSVAIKMIKSKIATKAKQTEKFIAEAIVTGDLEHPNIVPIHELGKDQHGNYFYAMKHVQGTPWNKVIKVMELHENLDVLLRTCDAIAFAHARGIIHRDLKPENIMLGDYGEVLVMDWGLALPTDEFPKKDRISSSHGMGGTPAYMAPEMATGPISRVNYTSDVYLLGAILYEIVTGHPPHRGKTTQQCLAAAMRNLIAPADQENELIEIALKAMHTETHKRHKSVKLFQSAVRNYLAHEKSLEISRRANREFQLAKESSDYTSYSRSLFGFEEALALWIDNDDATEGLLAVRLDYAQKALEKGDFDLAESLVDATDPEHEELIVKIRDAKEDRLARQRMFRLAKQAVGVLAATILIVVGISYVLINRQMQRAIAAKQEADEQREIAEDKTRIADEQREIALVEREKAVQSSNIAIAERARAEEREQEAQTQRAIALQEKEKAELARQAEQYESYIARIGLAAAKVDENAFSDARELLLQCPEELRNWEWGRLMYLCSQSSRVYESAAPVDGLSLSPDGKRFATASWDGKAKIWDRESGEVLHQLPHDGIYVHAVNWSPQAELLATGSADTAGNLKLWNTQTGVLQASVKAHDHAVINVKFSDNGQWLLSTSYDNTAKLWNVSNPSQPELMTTLVGHTWWVWGADFIPGFDPTSSANRVVTVGQDGKAIVWAITENGRKAETQIEYLEHEGAVYCVAFNPGGTHIATGSYDRQIHYWNPDEIEPFDFEAAVNGERKKPQRYLQLTGHIGPVRCLKFSQSDNLLVSGAQDNAVKVWQLETGTSIKTFRGHDSAVRACGISPDGKYVLSGSEDQQTILWSITDYAEIHTLAGQELTGHADAILSAYFAPSGQDVVTASRDRSARIWNARTGKQERLLAEGHQFLSSSAVFLKEEQYLFTAAADNTVRLWSASTGSEILTLHGTGRGALLAISENEQWLATGSETDEILLWKVEDLLAAGDQTPQPARRLQGHKHPATALRFAPGSTRLVSGDTHGRCTLWDFQQQTPLWSTRNHTMKISDLHFSPDGKLLYTASLDRTVGVYDTTSGEELTNRVLKHPFAVVALAMTSDGQKLVTVTNRSDADENSTQQELTVFLWQAGEQEPQQVWNVTGQSANDLSINSQGSLAYLTCSDNTLKRLDLSTGQVVTLIDGNQHGGLLWSSVLSRDDSRILLIGGIDASLWDLNSGQERMSFGPHGAVAATAINPAGDTVVTGSWDHSLKFWNAKTGQALKKVTGAHQGYINTVDFSPDGRWIVTGGDDRIVRIWDAETATEVKQLVGHQGDIHRALFSPNGQLILTASGDRTLRLWDRTTGQTIGEPFRGHRWAVLSADFSPSGQRIVSCSEDNKAFLWDLATRKKIVELSGHTAAVTSVRFSPDGQRVLTASRDNTAKLWDVTKGHEGNEILTLKRHTQEVTAVDFSANSLQVLTSSRDGTAILWPAIDWRVPMVADKGKQ